MKKLYDNVLSELFHKTADGAFMTMYDLEMEFGETGEKLRSLLEDLKADGLVVEHQEGFQVSIPGINYCKSKWG